MHGTPTTEAQNNVVLHLFVDWMILQIIGSINGSINVCIIGSVDLSRLPGREEECVPLLEGHGRAELWLLVVVAQVRDLVQVTGKRGKRFDFGAIASLSRNL